MIYYIYVVDIRGLSTNVSIYIVPTSGDKIGGFNMFNNGKINGYDYEIDEKRIIWFKADQMAEKLGLVQFKKKVKYVRWDYQRYFPN